jgi:hypothetical protein
MQRTIDSASLSPDIMITGMDGSTVRIRRRISMPLMSGSSMSSRTASIRSMSRRSRR